MRYTKYYNLCRLFLNWNDHFVGKAGTTKYYNNTVKTCSIVPTRQKDSKGTLTMTGISLDFTSIGHDEPILTRRYIDPIKTSAELLWFLRDSTKLDILHKYNNHWWDPFVPLGPIYGAQLSKNNQLYNFLKGIEKDRYGRRHMINFWAVEDLPKMTLPPCITHLQLVITPPTTRSKFEYGRDLATLIVNQRSSDLFMGLPHDILKYQLFMLCICKYFNLNPHKLVHNLGSAHMYLEHVEANRKMLEQPIITSGQKTRHDVYRRIELSNFPNKPSVDDMFKHLTEDLIVENFVFDYYFDLPIKKIPAKFFP